MNMLIVTLQQASANPYSWGIVGLIGAVALFSYYKWRACPYLCHTKAISLDESHQQLNRSFVAGPRFVVVMLVGIAAIVTGLGMVSHEVNPLLALMLIVAGVFAVQIEPANPWLWHRLAVSRRSLGEFELAVNLAEKSISLAGTKPRLQAENWRLVADIRRTQGRAADANTAAGKAKLILAQMQ